MDFDQAVISFTIACRASGRISERTLANHLHDLSLFHRQFPHAIDTWTRDHIRLFLAKPTWSAATKLIRWKSLHAFFGFCLDEEILHRNPMTGVERPSGAKQARRPDRLTERDMDLLLFAWPEWTWMGLRNRAILWCFFTTPFRRGELAGIQIADVDLIHFTLRTRNRKGFDEGYMAQLHPKCAQALDRYRRKLPPELAEKPHLWIAKNGAQMTGAGLYQMLDTTEQRAKEAGFSKHFNPHSYRHNWGIQTVEWGLAKDVAAKTMGHKSDHASEIYRQWALEEQAESQVRRIFKLPK